MTLPNARSGVNKLFIAEIFKLIGVILLFISLTLLGTVYGVARSGAQIPSSAEATMGGLAMGGMLTLLGGTAFPLIALILTLVGLKQASKDEPDNMGKAFAFAITTLILQLCASIVIAIHWRAFGNFLTYVASITDLVATVFTIMGVSEVTQRISRQDVADMGPKVITISVIAIVIALIAMIIGNTIGGIFALVSLCFMLVAYFVFLVFLGRASGALKQA